MIRPTDFWFFFCYYMHILLYVMSVFLLFYQSVLYLPVCGENKVFILLSHANESLGL